MYFTYACRYLYVPMLPICISKQIDFEMSASKTESDFEITAHTSKRILVIGGYQIWQTNKNKKQTRKRWQ